MLLYDQIKQCKLKPVDFISCFLANIGGETEQLTLTKIIGKVSYIMGFFIPVE